MRSTMLPLLLLAGCSLLNQPDRNLIPGDGGPRPDLTIPDAGPDVDVFDGGTDGGPEICDEPEDEDGDGLTNCSDFDCVGFAGCCLNGIASAIDFGTQALWTPIGEVSATAERVVFGEMPSIYVNNRCFPMAQGAEFSFFIDLDGAATSDCEENGERCSQFAAFFVSSVTDASEDSRIVAELGVTLYGSGRAELYRGRDTVIDTISWALSTNRVPVTLRLTPDIEGAEPVLRAEVSVAGMPFVEQPTFAQADLIRECRDGIGGLHFGVEGVGSRVRVLGVNAKKKPLECTNPTQFEPTLFDPLVAMDADSTHISLDWTGEWTAGDVTHPELVRVSAGGANNIWHVYASSGSHQLELSYLPNFVWTMGHSTTPEWNQTLWDNDADTDRYHELPGQQPTVALDGSGGELVVAVIDDGLHYCPQMNDCLPLNIECNSLANPSIVRTPGNKYLLFYQCTQDGEYLVFSQPLASNVLSMRPAPQVVLSSRDFGALARDTIVDFDVLLDERITMNEDGTIISTEYVIRAWFVGEALGNVRTLLLATASLKIDEMAELDPLEQEYRLIPYAGNPIATENVLFRDPMQSLQGVSVERRNESPRDLIFLFGRRTDRPEGRLYDFVPIEQTWGAL